MEPHHPPSLRAKRSNPFFLCAARWIASLAMTTLSKRRVSPIDHKTIRRMIRRRLAHDVDRDAAEIRGFAEPAYWNPRHHVGDEFVVGHDAGGHIAPAPAGADRIGGNPVTARVDREDAGTRLV